MVMPASAPAATAGLPAVAASPSAGGWPVRRADIDAWASRYHPALRQYLQVLGGVIVAVTGDPDAVRSVAARWEDLGDELTVQAKRVADSDALATGWQGQSRYAFAHLQALVVRGLKWQVGQARRVSVKLRAGADTQVTARQQGIRITEAFLLDAEATRQWASTVPLQSGTGPAMAFQQRLPSVFEVHHRSAEELVRWFRSRTAELANTLADAEPALVGRVRDRVIDFFHYDVPERLDELVNLPGYQRDWGAVDGGLLAGINAVIAKYFDGAARTTPTEGATGTYAGFTISSTDCAKAAAAGAAAVALKSPAARDALARLGAACLVADTGTLMATGKQAAAQVVAGWGPDSVYPDGASARVGLRDYGAPSTFWAGRSRAWAWQLEDHTVRFGCTRFDYLDVPLPLGSASWTNGTFETLTVDGKLTAGFFSEFGTPIGVPGRASSLKDWAPVAGTSRGGATFCGGYVNLYWR